MNELREAFGVRSEAAEQRDVVEWLELRKVHFCHPANEGKRTGKEAKLQQRAGLKPGVPDLLIFTPAPRAAHYRGVAIEMKRSDCDMRDVTDEQERFIDELKACGWYVVVCFSAMEAIRVLEQLGY